MCVYTIKVHSQDITHGDSRALIHILTFKFFALKVTLEQFYLEYKFGYVIVPGDFNSYELKSKFKGLTYTNILIYCMYLGKQR